MRLAKSSRLRARSEFLAVQERGARLASTEYAVLAFPNQCGCARLGVTVSSKVANAVVRNRVKRWVREAFREVAGDLPPIDLLVIARRGAAQGGLPSVRRALAAARSALGVAGGRG